MKRILAIAQGVARESTQAQLDAIRRAAGEAYDVMPLDAVDESDKARVEILYGYVEREAAAKYPNLRWMQLTSAGVEHFLRAQGALREDFILTNATGAYGECISEHILALMLGLQRGLHQYRDFQRAHEWKDAPIYRNFHGSTVVVVGLGDIGRATARKCAALGARVKAVKRSAAEKPDYIEELAFDLDHSLDAMLAKADFVALCLPNTVKTANVLSRERLGSMKDHAVIVNIGRGALVDQEALAEEIQKGRLMAGLDVMTPEPLDQENPLWDAADCWITPHMAGRSAHNMDKIHAIFLQNLTRYLRGEALLEIVDFEAGY